MTGTGIDALKYRKSGISIHNFDHLGRSLNVYNPIQMYLEARMEAINDNDRCFLGSKAREKIKESDFFRKQPIGRKR